MTAREVEPAHRLDLEDQVGFRQEAAHLGGVRGILDERPHRLPHAERPHGRQPLAIALGEGAADLEGWRHDVDRLARPHEAARSVLQDQPIAVHRRHTGALAAVGEPGVHRRLHLDRMAQAHLGERRDRRADDTELSSLEIDPQRLSRGGKPPQYRLAGLADRHDGVEAEAGDPGAARDLLDEGRVGWDGDDGADGRGRGAGDGSGGGGAGGHGDHALRRRDDKRRVTRALDCRALMLASKSAMFPQRRAMSPMA